MAGTKKLLFFLFLCHGSFASFSLGSSNSTDELVLLSFLSSGQSSILDSWNASSQFCNWPGVVCGRLHPDRVVALRMSSFNLFGSISPFLGNLSFLKELDLSDNQLVGRVPLELGYLSRLQLLNLSINHLKGSIPVTLGGCSKLKKITLYKNQLQGSFGSVYKGELLNGPEGESTYIVAVKVLRLQTPKALKTFTAECETLRYMRHRNLVKIVTICSSSDNKGNDFKAIVYDFMPNGSLEGWLHLDTNDKEERRYLNLLERVAILLDVAYALDYLHCHGPEPVVHCDLKSSNVLLDADMVAHVGDFGLAKILVEGNSLLRQSTSSIGFRGTTGYAAPGSRLKGVEQEKKKKNCPWDPPVSDSEKTQLGRGRAAPPVARRMVAGVRPTAVAADRRAHARVRTSLLPTAALSEPHSLPLSRTLSAFASASTVAAAPRHRRLAVASRSSSTSTASPRRLQAPREATFPFSQQAAVDRPLPPCLRPPRHRVARHPRSSLEAAADHRNPHLAGETTPPASHLQEKLGDSLLRAPVKLSD
ncbi:hypothetical protein PR202_ga22177 [Eleusine coracana subsp. coracana]|uniref:Protein kinase domain-containing protein n=1 Tax=Eleusine coracana subsp. coracana TaxID=191504 RepID=A0AAV5D3D4_ELECO|nr:hypothetical protein PR202_ga22177 [Eleusine coracana subsp. coracana]